MTFVDDARFLAPFAQLRHRPCIGRRQGPSLVRTAAYSGALLARLYRRPGRSADAASRGVRLVGNGYLSKPRMAPPHAVQVSFLA